MPTYIKRLITEYFKNLSQFTKSEARNFKKEIFALAEEEKIEISNFFEELEKNDAQKSPIQREKRVKRPASPKKEKTAIKPKEVAKTQSVKKTDPMFDGANLKLNSDNKIELILDGKSGYTKLPEEIKKKIKSSFLWSRTKNAWVSRSRGGSIPMFLLEYNIPYIGADERASFEEREINKISRAENRVDRFEKYSENANKRSDALRSEWDQLRQDWSWVTQPNVNSAGGRRFTKQRQKVIDKLIRSFGEYEKSQYWTEKANISQKTMAQNNLKDPYYLQNRIKEAQKKLKNYPKFAELFEIALKKEIPEHKIAYLEGQMNFYKEAFEKLAYYEYHLDKLREEKAEEGKSLKIDKANEIKSTLKTRMKNVLKSRFDIKLEKLTKEYSGRSGDYYYLKADKDLPEDLVKHNGGWNSKSSGQFNSLILDAWATKYEKEIDETKLVTDKDDINANSRKNISFPIIPDLKDLSRYLITGKLWTSNKYEIEYNAYPDPVFYLFNITTGNLQHKIEDYNTSPIFKEKLQQYLTIKYLEHQLTTSKYNVAGAIKVRQEIEDQIKLLKKEIKSFDLSKNNSEEKTKFDTSGIISFEEYQKLIKGYGSEKLPKEFLVLEYAGTMAERLCNDNNNPANCISIFNGLRNRYGSFREGIVFAYSKKNRNLSLFRTLKSTMQEILGLMEKSGFDVKFLIKMVDDAEYQDPEEKKSSAKNNILYKGNNVILETPSEEIKSYYAIMELKDVIQSHNEKTFDWNPKYPKQCQERDYRQAREKNKVLQFASNFKPHHFINDSPEAMTGPPVVSPDGIVLGGNGRTMMLKVVDRLGNYEKYVDYLSERVQNFGFQRPTFLKNFKAPVLVRVVDVDMSNCALMSRILNESMSLSKDENTNSISLAKSLSQKGFIEISQIFDNEDTGTFNSIISESKNQKLVIDVLRKNNIITQSNAPQWLSEKGDLTATGKNNLENLLLAKILPSEELIEGAKEYTNRILKAIPVLTKIQTLPEEYDLIPLLRDVIKFENIRRTQGVSIKEFLKQESMFGESEKPDTLVAMLWLALNSGITKFREILEAYYNSAKNNTSGDSMFGFETQATPENILTTIVDNRGLSDRIKLNSRVVDSNYIKKGNEVHGFTGKDCKYYYVAGNKFNNGAISFIKTAMNNLISYNRKNPDPQAKVYRFTNKSDANKKMKELLTKSGYFSNTGGNNVQLTLANKPKKDYGNNRKGLSNKAINHLQGAKKVIISKNLTFSQKLKKLLEY